MDECSESIRAIYTAASRAASSAPCGIFLILNDCAGLKISLRANPACDLRDGMNSSEQGVVGIVYFKIKLWIALALLGITFFLLFLKWPELRAPLAYSAALVSALTVVLSAYYLVTNSAITIARDKVHRSFEFTKQLNDVNLTRIRTFLDNELDHHVLAPSEFYKKVAANPEIASSLKCLLGVFEDASIAVQYDYVDEKTLYASLCFLVPWSAENFRPYISEQRRISGDGILYAELDKLADAWKKKLSLRTGKPL